MRSFGGLRVGRSICPVLFAVVAMSCATKTLVADRWVSPDYEGGAIHKFLIVGVAESDIGRRTYEDGFAKALRNLGADAVPSYRMMPSTDRLERDELEAVVRTNGFDGVIVTRLLDVSEETTVVPPSTYVVPTAGIGPGYYGYYGRHYEIMHDPGYTRTTQIFRLETRLWDTEDSQLIWGVVSETFDPKSTTDGVASVTRALASQLSADGLVAK